MLTLKEGKKKYANIISYLNDKLDHLREIDNTEVIYDNRNSLFRKL